MKNSLYDKGITSIFELKVKRDANVASCINSKILPANGRAMLYHVTIATDDRQSYKMLSKFGISRLDLSVTYLYFRSIEYRMLREFDAKSKITKGNWEELARSNTLARLERNEHEYSRLFRKSKLDNL